MRKRTRRPTFGSAGTKLIEYTAGEGVFGPFVTSKIYRFRSGKNPRLVDLRDLTLLAKAAGRKNLRDVSEEQEAEKQRLEGPKKPKRVREKSKPVEVPVEQEEVDNATE
jgi:hypothetical protein